MVFQGIIKAWTVGSESPCRAEPSCRLNFLFSKTSSLVFWEFFDRTMVLGCQMLAVVGPLPGYMGVEPFIGW